MTTQLPVIDFAAAAAPQAFTRSLHETGFAVLRNHPLAYAMVQGIYAEWAAFFRSEAKHAYDYDRQTHAGYFSPDISETAKGQKQRTIVSLPALCDRPQGLEHMGRRQGQRQRLHPGGQSGNGIEDAGEGREHSR